MKWKCCFLHLYIIKKCKYTTKIKLNCNVYCLSVKISKVHPLYRH